MKKRIFAALLCLIICFAFVSCGNEKQSEDDGRLKVVATLFPQYDFARAVAGDRADISLLLPPGAESHSFDPSMSDIIKASDADIFIYTGEHMEHWAESFFSVLDEDCIIVDVSDGIALSSPKSGDTHIHDGKEQDGHDHGINVDPHIWTSPKNAETIVRSICSSICNADEENRSYYEENTEEYIKELSALDEDFCALAEESYDKKLFFGGKFAFHYLMSEYGFSYVSLYDSCSESAEPGAKKLEEMIRIMNDTGAKSVFYPELSEPKAAISLAENTRATPVLLHSCHNLSKDELESGGTYLSLMRQNLENIKEALY